MQKRVIVLGYAIEVDGVEEAQRHIEGAVGLLGRTSGFDLLATKHMSMESFIQEMQQDVDGLFGASENTS